MYKGGYHDELIIKARREQDKREQDWRSEQAIKRELEQSIYDEVVYIFGTPVLFQDFTIIEERATLRMPADFIARSEEEIAGVYFWGAKPQYVFSNGYLDFMVTLNWTQNLIADSNIFDFTQFAKQAIERIGSKARILNVDKLAREDGNLAILQFSAQPTDSVNYNVMFYFSIEGRLLIGSVTFDQKYSNRLVPLALEIVKSFRMINQKRPDKNELNNL